MVNERIWPAAAGSVFSGKNFVKITAQDVLPFELSCGIFNFLYSNIIPL